MLPAFSRLVSLSFAGSQTLRSHSLETLAPAASRLTALDLSSACGLQGDQAARLIGSASQGLQKLSFRRCDSLTGAGRACCCFTCRPCCKALLCVHVHRIAHHILGKHCCCDVVTCHLLAAGLQHLAPLLVCLKMPQCFSVAGRSLSVLPALTWLDISRCSAIGEAGIAALALLTRLQRLTTSDCWNTKRGAVTAVHAGMPEQRAATCRAPNEPLLHCAASKAFIVALQRWRCCCGSTKPSAASLPCVCLTLQVTVGAPAHAAHSLSFRRFKS